MDALQAYVLPVRGLQTGRHQYEFLVDDEFFAAFPDSPVQRAKLQLDLQLDRRQREITIDFNFAGTVQTECDRCLTPIDLQVEGEEQLLVQITSDPDRVSDEPEMIYLYEEEAFLQVAPFVYEFILLSIPIVKVCENADPPATCDEEMIAKLKALDITERENEQQTTSSSPWDVLKDWKKQ